jgi:MFS family permease
MPIRLTGKFQGLFTRDTLISIFLLTSALVWYSYAIVLLQESIEGLNLDFLSNMLVWGAHFAALILSALLGSLLTKTMGGRTRFLAIWVLIGTISSLAPFALNTAEAWGTITLGLIFGFSLGFGMPNCMGYFTHHTPVENRGKIGGLIFVFTGLLTVALDILGINGLVSLSITLVVLRGVSLLAIPLVKVSDKIEQTYKPSSYRNMINQKPFVLYLVPWILFCLLNYLTTPVEQNIILVPSVFSNMQLLQNIFFAIFALAGGVFMDKVGRKRIAITGFVLQGLSCSLVGFFHDPSIWYFHSILNGISWGILCVLFVLTIWGDLSHEAASDKYYALGVSPFFISKMLQLTIDSQIVAAIDATAIFSFTALFLFLAVLPLIYAPETLPEKTMKDRDLKSYIAKAQKEVAKAQKNEDGKQCENKDEEDSVEFKVNQEDDEKARELAEKYY